jgi:biopolymer transport protein ExbD
MSLDKQPDLRAVLQRMGEEYGVKFNAEQEKKFSVASTFGVPIASMPEYLNLPSDKQDEVLKNEGIPCDSTDNQFKSWVKNAKEINPDLRIAIKADSKTPYAVIKKIMNSLQDIRENRYNLITNLKTTSEE